MMPAMSAHSMMLENPLFSQNKRSCSVVFHRSASAAFHKYYSAYGQGTQILMLAAYWNGSAWIPANVSPNYIMVTKNPSTYTFTVSGLHRSAFYVLFSKIGSGYDNYYFDSDIHIAD